MAMDIEATDKPMMAMDIEIDVNVAADKSTLWIKMYPTGQAYDGSRY